MDSPTENDSPPGIKNASPQADFFIPLGRKVKTPNLWLDVFIPLSGLEPLLRE